MFFCFVLFFKLVFETLCINKKLLHRKEKLKRARMSYDCMRNRRNRQKTMSGQMSAGGPRSCGGMYVDFKEMDTDTQVARSLAVLPDSCFLFCFFGFFVHFLLDGVMGCPHHLEDIGLTYKSCVYFTSYDQLLLDYS